MGTALIFAGCCFIPVLFIAKFLIESKDRTKADITLMYEAASRGKKYVADINSINSDSVTALIKEQAGDL